MKVKVVLTVWVLDYYGDDEQLAEREFTMSGDIETIDEVKIEPIARMVFNCALDDAQELPSGEGRAS